MTNAIDIEIENGIAIPKRHYGWGPKAKGRGKYQIAISKMDVGQSFVVKSAAAGSVTNAVRSLNKENGTSIKMAQRRTDTAGMSRFWRVA
jgi:hypothetical protein